MQLGARKCEKILKIILLGKSRSSSWANWAVRQGSLAFQCDGQILLMQESGRAARSDDWWRRYRLKTEGAPVENRRIHADSRNIPGGSPV